MSTREIFTTLWEEKRVANASIQRGVRLLPDHNLLYQRRLASSWVRFS